MTVPRRIFHVERLTRYRTGEVRFRIFEQIPSGLRPLANDNGQDGPDGVTYPFQIHSLDRNRSASYQFAVPRDLDALDLLCHALANHFGEPIGIYKFGMSNLPVRVYEPSAGADMGPASRARSRRLQAAEHAAT